MATQQNFRTAFIGFNREDVVHYIEFLNTTHAAEVSQLKSEIEFLRSKRAEEVPAEQQTDAPVQVEALPYTELEEELSALRAENEELKTQLSDAMAAGDEIAEQLNAAVAEKIELAEKLEAALQQQSTFESRTAEELEAYRRAERTERKAQQRAEQMYRQANGIITDVSTKVNDTAAQIGELSERVLAQLGQLQEAVTGSNAALKEAADLLIAVQHETEE